MADELEGDELAVAAETVNNEAAEISAHRLPPQGTAPSLRVSWVYPSTRRRTDLPSTMRIHNDLALITSLSVSESAMGSGIGHTTKNNQTQLLIWHLVFNNYVYPLECPPIIQHLDTIFEHRGWEDAST